MMFGREGQPEQNLAAAPSEYDDQQKSPQAKAVQKQPADDSLEMPEDNPISAMMALKHPERQREIENMQTEEMAQSHYSNYVTTY